MASNMKMKYDNDNDNKPVWQCVLMKCDGIMKLVKNITSSILMKY